jgi:hypothetical protein
MVVRAFANGFRGRQAAHGALERVDVVVAGGQMMGFDADEAH